MNFQVYIYILCLYCDMFPCFYVKKVMYLSHTSCAAAPIFTLCHKPEPSLLWLVSWPALLWSVNRHLDCQVQCVGAITDRSTRVIYWCIYVMEVNKEGKWRRFRQGGSGSQLKAATPPPWRTPITAAYMQHTFLIMTIYLGLQYCVHTCCMPVATQLTWKLCWYWHLV